MAPAQAKRASDESSATNGKPRPRAQKTPSAATPWGSATILEEAVVRQQAGDKRFAVVVQLLEAGNGERLVRFAYMTSGSTGSARARRGPVTMRARDLGRLRAALEGAPALREVLAL